MTGHHDATYSHPVTPEIIHPTTYWRCVWSCECIISAVTEWMLQYHLSYCLGCQLRWRLVSTRLDIEKQARFIIHTHILGRDVLLCWSLEGCCTLQVSLVCMAKSTPYKSNFYLNNFKFKNPQGSILTTISCVPHNNLLLQTDEILYKMESGR